MMFDEEKNENTTPVEETIVEVPVTQVAQVTEDSSGRKQKRSGSPGWKPIIAVAVICAILGGAIGTGITLMIPKTNKIIYTTGNDAGKTSAVTNVADFDSLFKISDNATQTSFLTDIAKNVSPSVVGVRATPPENTSPYSFMFGDSGSSASEGSGIILTADGYIITNSHVIASALDANGVILANAKVEIFTAGKLDTPYTAEVIGWDRITDLAVLKVDVSGLIPITFSDSDKVAVGEAAVAIGNPGGLEYMGSVTFGVISGLNRTVQTEDGRSLTYIQTDAAINPGNSGGALLNGKGELIGINTIKIAATGYEGLGFAIPSNTVKQISGNLITFRYVPGRSYLGISAETQYTAQYAKRNNTPEGVYVSEVTALSAAYKAGIKVHDIITKFNGVAVSSLTDLKAEITKTKPGDTIKVELYRTGDKKTMEVEVTMLEDKGSN